MANKSYPIDPTADPFARENYVIVVSNRIMAQVSACAQACGKSNSRQVEEILSAWCADPQNAGFVGKITSARRERLRSSGMAGMVERARKLREAQAQE